MLRVFSTPAPESSQFILKLQFSDPRRAPGELLCCPPPYRNSNYKVQILDIVFSRMRYLGGFRSSRCHHPNPLREIYNLGMVPDLPELKNHENIGNTSKVLERRKRFFFEKNKKCKMGVKSVGSGRGTSILCQNDQLRTPDVLGPILNKN